MNVTEIQKNLLPHFNFLILNFLSMKIVKNVFKTVIIITKHKLKNTFILF
uniref:Uncharacterized protein n=1 Tax=Siphoviridae sp. ctYcY12 TaxID=2825550 RepID=A0A8S5TU17_9CAUD|nr:MAG TPA: hypothetical protein [Siphoviridae sp. ctYcY12]